MRKYSYLKTAIETERQAVAPFANDNFPDQSAPTPKVIGTKRLLDLEWQINFTTQKLRRWKGLDNHQWVHLDQLNKKAKMNHQEIQAQALSGL
ncbi:MAG: hypothetical protein HKN36_05060 [Hellea sp.]|nr:hypothetical protein [Hellea sp.]